MPFKRQIENFICEHCGTKVVGNGYTNHCPNCLWSKHVDEKFPGDRASECLGMMEPISYEQQGDHWVITHKCVKCGKISKQKVDEAPIQLIKKH